MDDHIGTIVVGVLAGAAIVVLAIVVTLGFTAEGIKTVALDLTPPVFYVPN